MELLIPEKSVGKRTVSKSRVRGSYGTPECSGCCDTDSGPADEWSTPSGPGVRSSCEVGNTVKVGIELNIREILQRNYFSEVIKSSIPISKSPVFKVDISFCSG
jgi:hypothetical protein